MKKSALAVMLSSALLAGSAVAHEAGSTILRVGGVFVEANSTSKAKTGVDVKLDVRNNAQLGLTATYMLTDNLGVELLGATPFSHYIDAEVPPLQILPDIDLPKGATLNKAVKVKHLPPSLYAQYYFLDKNAGARPYVGAGLNYTRFFNAKALSPLVTDLKVKKHSFGPVVNAGIDIKLTDNIALNTAMWYTRIKTKANFNALAVGGQPVHHEVKIKLDPIVYFAGLSFKF